MADEAQRFTARTWSLQSRIANSKNAKQQQAASSSAAAKSGSTTTPTITSTPKVTNTAKAMPSVTRVDISKLAVPTVTPTVTTPREQAMNLLGSKTRVEPLKKAEVPNMLNWQAQPTWIAWTINKWLYEIPQKITQEFWETVKESNLFEKWKNLVIDTARFWISTAQWLLERYWTTDLPVWWQTLNNSEMGTKIKEQRNNTLKTIFNELESRDQWLSKDKWYQESKKEAEKWAESWKWIWQALQESNWDVVITRAGEIVAQMIPAFATAIITKNPKIAAWTVFTTVYWDAYKRNLTDVVKDPDFKNLTWQQKTDLASLLATTEATIETLWDMLELAPFMKGKTSISKMLWIKNALASFVANWQWSAITEWLEEVSTEALQTWLKQAYGSLDEISLKELWQIFSDTYLLMQIAWLWWWAWWVVETRNRNETEKILEQEAKKFNNFNDFESAAQRWWVEDNSIIQDAWANAKWLTKEQSQTIKYDVKYVEKQEAETTKLYEEKESVENKLESLRESWEEKNKTQISKLETRLQEIDNQINEIDKSIQEYMEVYWEELPATQQEESIPEWESQASIDQGEVSQWEWNISDSKESFDKSVEDVKNGTEYWNTDFAKNYAYKTSWRYIVWDTKQNQQLRNKVQQLLKWIWIKIRFVDSSKMGTRWLYNWWIVYYDKSNKELTLYWHEVFHAMMDVIKNGKLDDAELQAELQDILNQAIEEVKKEFWINGYKSWKELELANKFSEEWLANAFWEYLHDREINWPKTFVQKIVSFFNSIIDLFSWNKKKPLSKELKKAFDKIVSWEVTGRRWIPTVIATPSASPIESSTDETQEAMANVDEEWYKDLVKENELQSKQQQELWDNYKKIVEAGKESDKENETYDEDLDAWVLDEVTWGDIQTSPQTIKDMFSDNPKKRKKAFRIMNTEVWQAVKDAFTPALTRIYNISPRVAWRIVQMETQSEINIYRFRERAKPFVEAVSKLNKKDKLELKKALLDYWALASEQTEESLAQYKEEEVKKLKEVFKKFWISEESANDMFAMLTELGQKYKDAWLSITLNDLYFPRTVTDYEWLSEYISDKTWVPQKEREDLLNRISKIRRNENLTDEQKEGMIRNLLVNDYKQPWTTSKNAKERKIWKLSDWWDGIYEFYADPMETLDNYIVNMETAIQRQLFLWWLKEEAWLKWENVSFTEIVEWLVDEGKISNEDLEELKKSVLAILNKKPSPKVVSKLKNLTYIATLANFLSAINQLDDLAVAIIKDKRWLINVVKAIFGKAGIKYTELWLEDSYEMFRWKWNITNWFFKKSLFNAIDRLGKTAFVNAAWDSLKTQAKKNKDWTDTTKRANLKKRLEEMYWKDTMEHIMKKIDEDSYMTNWQIDIDILTDLLYQLWSTQPIYTSSMPTAYLNNGWVRLCYALQSFTIKRIDMLVQWAYNVYKNNWRWAKWAVKAWAWLMEVSVFLALFWVAIWDLQDWIKWDTDETALWKLFNEWIDEALNEVWNEWKASWLKIWNLSLYDKKTYQWQWLWGVIMNKVKPPMIWIGKNFLEAITEHNADEMTDLVQYVPIIWKLLYYRFLDEIESETTKKEEEWETTGETEAWESLWWEEDWETTSTKEDWE